MPKTPDQITPAVLCTGWLESIRKQSSTYRNEDNGDESKWSIYNQGRADALDRMEEDLRRMLSNDRISDPAKRRVD